MQLYPHLKVNAISILRHATFKTLLSFNIADTSCLELNQGSHHTTNTSKLTLTGTAPQIDTARNYHTNPDHDPLVYAPKKWYVHLMQLPV